MVARARVASTAEHRPAGLVSGVVLLLHFFNVMNAASKYEEMNTKIDALGKQMKV